MEDLFNKIELNHDMYMRYFSYIWSELNGTPIHGIVPMRSEVESNSLKILGETHEVREDLRSIKERIEVLHNPNDLILQDISNEIMKTQLHSMKDQIDNLSKEIISLKASLNRLNAICTRLNSQTTMYKKN